MRRWQGQADPPLSASGIDQARRAAGEVAGIGPFDVVISSTLRRAHQTAQLLAEHSDTTLGAAHDGLIERAAGPWEGLTRFEIEDRYPGYLDDGRRPEGYELDGSVVDRSTAALLDVVQKHAGATIVVVSHGGVINALERHVGEEWRRLDNLEGRWFQSDGCDIVPVGERVRLLGWDSPSVDRTATERTATDRHSS